MLSTRKKLTLFITAVVVSLVFVAASFQKASATDINLVIDNMPRIIGLGVGFAPDYEGSDDYMFGVAPFARFQFKGHQQYLLLKGYELQINLIDHSWFRLGPSVNYHFGRDHDVDDSVVKKMKKIDDTIEAGGFVGVEFIDKQNPRKRFLADIDFLTDVGNEYDGYYVKASGRVWYPLSQMFDFGFGLGLCYASDNYMSTYFGVSRKDSLRTGLPVFDADSGVKDVRVNTVFVMHLNMNWHLATGIQYRRLVGDADDSPVVDDRGSSNQWLGGIGLAYSW